MLMHLLSSVKICVQNYHLNQLQLYKTKCSLFCHGFAYLRCVVNTIHLHISDI